MKPSFLSALFGASLVGLSASTIAHVSTFYSLHFPERFPWLWCLHAGIFIVFLPFVLACRSLQSKRGFWRGIVQPIPIWGRIAVVSVFVYTGLNFFRFLALSEGGVPIALEGHYTLRSHGRLIRELNYDEYRQQREYGLRGFSGHWIAFYAISALFFYTQLHQQPK